MLGMKLDVDLKSIKDDLIGSECSYLFVKYPSNGLKIRYEDLLVRAYTMRSGALARYGLWSWKAVS
jgi:hypothetical protein